MTSFPMVLGCFYESSFPRGAGPVLGRRIGGEFRRIRGGEPHQEPGEPDLLTRFGAALGRGAVGGAMVKSCFS